MSVQDLGRGRFLLDLDFRDTQGIIASYLLPAPDGYVLVETGPSSTLRHLVADLAEAGIDVGEIRRIFVTHIHLDHAGALGAAAATFPRATMYVHREGFTHLVDPTRLIASARRAWGAASDTLWGPIVPVPADRLVPLEGGERFPLQGGELRVLATPGHARHHLAFTDTATRALLTGDAAGVRLPGMALARPAVPPPDLDLGLLFESLAAMEREGFAELWYSHFGPVPGGAEDLARYRGSVERWRDAALLAARSDPSVPSITKALIELDATDGAGDDPSNASRQEMISGYELAAQGLLRYFRGRGEIPPAGS